MSGAIICNGIISFYRSTKNSRGYFMLSIVGIATTLAAFIYIISYTIHERSYDVQHPDFDQIYRVAWHARDANSKEYRTQNATSFQGVSRLQTEVAGIKAAAGLFRTSGIFMINDDNFNEQRIFFTSSGYFNTFRGQLKAGDPRDLDKPGSAFLTESIARRYFGNLPAVGKRFRFRDVGFGGVVYEFEVKGILHDYPVTTHLKTNVLLSMTDLERESKIIMGNVPDMEWRWAAFHNYVVLEPFTDPRPVEQSLIRYVQNSRERYDKNSQTITELELQPVKSIYLGSNYGNELEPGGNKKLLTYLTVVALFVLALGWLNYINLTTANLIGRAKEAGVKKLMGATKAQITIQTLLETLIVNTIALVLAGLILFLLKDFFSQIVGKEIFLSIGLYRGYLPIFLILFVLCSLLTGLYPALVLAGFEPTLIMKGAFKNTATGKWLRNGMVGLQYVVVICLISNLTIFYFQIRHMQSIDLGVNLESKLRLQVPWRDARDSVYTSTYSSFENELQQLPFVKSVTASSVVPGENVLWRTGANHQSDGNKAADIYRISARHNFFDFFEIKMLHGRALSPQGRREVVVNQRTLEIFGLKPDSTALQQTIIFHSGDTLSVVGVVADYHHNSPQFAIFPMAFQYSPTGGAVVTVSLQGQVTAEQLSQIKAKYDQFFSGIPFQYSERQDDFNKQYEADRRFASIFRVFSVLAIVISIIGLVGLAAYVSGLRAKEFSIRKTLGATPTQIFVMGVRYFIVIFLVAINISIPLSFFAAKSWLANYHARVAIHWSFFALPILCIVVITFLSVVMQSLKAATQSPINNLRSE